MTFIWIHMQDIVLHILSILSLDRLWEAKGFGTEW